MGILPYLTAWFRDLAASRRRRAFLAQVQELTLGLSTTRGNSRPPSCAGGRGEEVARGSMTTVCVAREPGSEEIRAIPIPREVDAAIEPAPEELLRDT